jgi:hypothetical protein
LRKKRAERLPPERWQQIINSYQKSGLTQKDYCREAGLGLSTLQNHIRRNGGVRGELSTTPKFVALAPTAEREALEVELALGSGITIRIRKVA